MFFGNKEGGRGRRGGGRFLGALGRAEDGEGIFGVRNEGFSIPADMSEGFEESDADRGGQVETAGGREHGNP